MVVVYVHVAAPVPVAQVLHVFTKHVPVDIVLLELFHVWVFQVLRFEIAVHAVEHVVFASVLNAVPVPAVVLPAGHAVHVLELALLYEPVAQAVCVDTFATQ